MNEGDILTRVDTGLKNRGFKIGQTTKGAKKLYKKAEQTYVAEDDIFRIASYEKELAVLKRANNLNPVSQRLSIEALENKAAEIVKNTLPTYDYVPAQIQKLRGLPFGNFYAFHAERFRNTYHGLIRGVEEINSGNAVLRERGMQRLSAKMVFGLGGQQIVSEGSKLMFGVTEQEDTAIKHLMLPKWSRNSEIAYYRDDDGNLIYMDLAYQHPDAPIINVFNAALNEFLDPNTPQAEIEDRLASGIFEASKELVIPFVTEALFTDAVFNVMLGQGRDSEGRIIRGWNIDEDSWNPMNMLAAVGHAAESLIPGTLKQLDPTGTLTSNKLGSQVWKSLTQENPVDRYGEKINPDVELFTNMTGLRFYKVTDDGIKRALEFKTRDFSRIKRAKENEVRNAIQYGTPVENILNTYLQKNKDYFDDYVGMKLAVEAARELGVPTDVITDRLKSIANMTGNERSLLIVGANSFVPLTINSSRMSEILDKASFDTMNFQEFNIEYNKLRQHLLQLPLIDLLFEQDITLEDEQNLKLVDEDFPFFKTRLEKAQKDRKDREGFFTGELVSKDYPVTDAAENPADRKLDNQSVSFNEVAANKENPYPTYDDEMKRLGFAEGKIARHAIEDLLKPTRPLPDIDILKPTSISDSTQNVNQYIRSQAKRLGLEITEEEVFKNMNTFKNILGTAESDNRQTSQNLYEHLPDARKDALANLLDYAPQNKISLDFLKSIDLEKPESWDEPTADIMMLGYILSQKGTDEPMSQILQGNFGTSKEGSVRQIYEDNWVREKFEDYVKRYPDTDPEGNLSRAFDEVMKGDRVPFKFGGPTLTNKQLLDLIKKRQTYLTDRLTEVKEAKPTGYTDTLNKMYAEEERLMSQQVAIERYEGDIVAQAQDWISWGLGQAGQTKVLKALGKLRRGKQAPASSMGTGPIIEGEFWESAEEALPSYWDWKSPYTGETPLFPSIYEVEELKALPSPPETKALPSPPETKFLEENVYNSALRALDLSESGEFSQLERNIKAGQPKGTVVQLINQAINKGRVTDEELKDLGLLGQTEWYGEDIGATKTTQEQLLEQMQERAARTKTEIRGDEDIEFEAVIMNPIVVDNPREGLWNPYPIWFEDTDGTDHSLRDMEYTLATINQALDNPESPPENIVGIANEFAEILDYEKETGESLWYSPSEFGDMDEESIARYVNLSWKIIDSKEGFDVDKAVKFLQGLEANEIEELVETKSRMDYVTGDPFRKVVFEQYPDTYMVGTEDGGFSLVHNNAVVYAEFSGNPIGSDAFTFDEAEVQLRNYIRNNLESAEAFWGDEVAQWRDQGTLPLMKDYEELTVIAESPHAWRPSSKITWSYEEGEHGMGENSIGHVQLSTRELGDGLDTTHIEAIQGDLIQSGEGSYLPYQKVWRPKVFREAIDRAIANGTNRVSWSPAWIQDMHWNQGTAIHNVADIELLAEVKKLEKEYGATFSFEEIVIDSSEYHTEGRISGSSSNLTTMINIIEKGVNQWTIKKWLHLPDLLEQQEVPFDQWSDLKANQIKHKEIARLKQGQGINKVTKVAKAKGRDLRTGEEVELKKLKVLDEELRIKPTGSSVERIQRAAHTDEIIKIQVPTLTFNEKAVSKWTRLGRRKYLQGGKAERVGVETDYGSTKVEDEDIKTLLKGSLALLQPSNDLSLEDIQKSKLSLWSGPDKFPIEEDIFMNNLMPLLKTKQGNMASSAWRNHEALIPLSEAAIRDYLYPQEKSRYNKQYPNYTNAHSTKTAMKAMSRHLQQERDRQDEGMNPTKLADILNIPFDKAAEFASSLLSRQD